MQRLEIVDRSADGTKLARSDAGGVIFVPLTDAEAQEVGRTTDPNR